MPTPFPVDPVLTAITIAYRNDDYIADDVLPRTPVAKPEFKWHKHRLADGFTIPDTRVGRTSAPNQVTFGFDEMTDAVTEYALDMPVPNADIEAASGSGVDPVGNATERGSNLIALDREVRTSRLVFNPASYITEHVKTTATAAKWNKPDSKPLHAIIDALDNGLLRPNIAILGNTAATALRRNPQILTAYYGKPTTDGFVPLDWLTKYLELDAIYVGKSRLNINRPGQNVELHRAWGPSAAFIYRDRVAGVQGGTTFGFTAQWGQRVAARIEDVDVGMRGGVRSRVGESLKEVIAAPELGFYFPDVVA